MKHHTIVGGGGTRLHVLEAGNPQGQAILFLHGFSQSSLAWNRQLVSDLAADRRLIAMDLRGHGESDRPRDGYEDSRLWADDVDAIIRELDLDRPILSGWSYGPLVILDYVRHHGEEHVGGIHFVGGISKLGSNDALAVLTPELLGIVPDLLADGAEASMRGLDALVRMFYVRDPSPVERYAVLGYAASVPPFVRQALFSRTLDNDDVLRSLRTPLLLTHGEQDRIVKLAVVDAHRALVRHAEVHVMPGAGHAAFWEDAPAFNRRLAQFADAVGRATSPAGVGAAQSSL